MLVLRLLYVQCYFYNKDGYVAANWDIHAVLVCVGAFAGVGHDELGETTKGGG